MRTGCNILFTCLFLFYINVVCAQIIDTVCSGSGYSFYEVDDHTGSSYQWSLEGGEIVSGNGTHSIIATWQTAPGTYRITVSERNITGCAGETQEAFVLVRGTFFKTSFPVKACLMDSVTIKAGGGRWYQWNNGLTDSTISLKLLGDTSLQVIISDTICGLKTDTFPIHITAVAKPDVAIVTSSNQVYLNQPVYFGYNGSPNDLVNWHIEKSTTPISSGHDVEVKFIDTGSAVIKLVSINPLGCKDSSYKTVDIMGEQLFFPSAFSPNRDGLNDIFRPGGTGASKFQLKIFNSWGQLIFVSNNDENGWDGTYEGQPAPTGSYIYQCDITGNSGKKYAYSGTITLIR